MRAGGDAAVQAFAFAYPREGPRWNGGTTLTLTDVQFRTAAGAAPATSAPVFARSPDYQRLLTAMATNNTPAIATLSTNSTVPTVRVLAALEAARRGRPAADLLRPMLGKMNDLGILGCPAPRARQKLIAVGDHAGAAAFCAADCPVRTRQRPGSDSEPLRLLAECVLATENLAAVERLLNGQLTGREADPPQPSASTDPSSPYSSRPARANVRWRFWIAPSRMGALTCARVSISPWARLAD